MALPDESGILRVHNFLNLHSVVSVHMKRKKKAGTQSLKAFLFLKIENSSLLS
jgi:hypothetical protein